MTAKQKKWLRRILISAAALAVLQLLPAALFDRLPGLGRWLRLGAYLALYWYIGGDILKKAWKGIRNRQVFDENFLMAIATVGAFAIAVYENGDYLEAIAVMLFYQVGEWFQSYAVGKSRRNISDLMDIRPDYANLETDGRLEQVDPEEVAAGSLIIVQPGEKIPIDGTVEEGISTLDTAALTGESMPRDVGPGEDVISGCINMTGVLKVRTTREFGESTVSKILDLVENASSRKSKSEDFISKFARYYTPVVCYAALALALLPPVFALLSGSAPMWGNWIYRALTFLVISCPCALVISIPLSFFAGIGGASKAGVLVKGSNYLETLSQVKTLVFDKTGTLTLGGFQVTGYGCVQGYQWDQVLEYAALAECASSHPIARSIQAYYGKEIDRSRVTDIREIPGKGITAMVDGISVAVGNYKMLHDMGIYFSPSEEEEISPAHVILDRKFAGYFLLSDELKPNARKAMKALRAAGIKQFVMLTGDNQKAAKDIAGRLNIDEYHAGLLPGDKVALVEKLLKESAGKLAFVGDGINDAPVLGRADIGIAMGAMGSDAAIEAADIVLMDDDPMQIAKAIRISRKTLSIVYQNIVFALGVKGVCLVLGALGIANMYLAIFADVGVMVIAVLNAIRALFVKKL